MRPRPPIGIVRPLVPILGRIRRSRRGGLAQMIWRRGRKRARPPFAARAARPLASSFHYSINLALTWPSLGTPRTPGEWKLERILRERLRAKSPSPLQPGAGQRRLPASVERLRRSRRGAMTAGNVDSRGATGPALSRAVATTPPRRGGARVEPGGEGPIGRARRRSPVDGIFAGRPSAARSSARQGIPSGSGARTDGDPAPRLPRGRQTGGDAGATVARMARQARTVAMRPERGVRAGLPPPAGRTGRPPRSDVGTATRHRPSQLVWRDLLAPQAERSRATLDARASGPRRARAELVWRDPAAAERQGEPLFESRISPPPVRDVEAAGPARTAAAPVSAAPIPAPDVGRLVDEVVRRLERIGRDERLRRGL